MKLSNDLVKDLQKARVYRSIAILLEICVFYLLIWGAYTAIAEIISWFS